jgi:hypothetical protein
VKATLGFWGVAGHNLKRSIVTACFSHLQTHIVCFTLAPAKTLRGIKNS